MNLIAIAGMHRSGTSFVAELVCAMGAQAGSELLEPAEDNPHGFFENQRVKELNDVVLRRLGGTWDRPPVGLSDRWQHSGGLDSIRRTAEVAVTALIAEADGAPACVIKDPRLSLTLPFWTSVVKVDRVVVPLRSPIEVAQSLRHRNGFSPDRTAALWLRYTVDALLHAVDPVIVPLDDVVVDIERGVPRLAAAVGLDEGVDAALELAAERRRTWVPAEVFADVPESGSLRLATAVFETLAVQRDVRTAAPLLEQLAAEWRVDDPSSGWSRTSGLRIGAAEATAERYRELRIEFEDLRLRAGELEEERNQARRELRDTAKRLTAEVEAHRAEVDAYRAKVEAHRAEAEARSAEIEAHRAEHRVLSERLEQRDRELAEVGERLEHEAAARTEAGRRLDEERGRRSEAEDRASDAARRAESQAKRARAAEQSFSRLRSRRSVRVATGLARPFRPVFHTVRRARRVGASTRRRIRRRANGSKSDSPSGGARIQKTRTTFPTSLDAATRATLRQHLADRPRLGGTTVSIIMPTYNRAGQIGDAISSVIAQTHRSWELLVVDDGSEDDTEAVVSRFVGRDERIRYVGNPRGGVSRARNTGLDLASGDVIAFLDTDNSWNPEFLALMVAELDRSGAPIAYSAMESVQNGEVVSYRGDRFDEAAMRSGNYIDLNVICHRREIADLGARFDPELRRTVDWDYLLEICRDREVSYAPFIGGTYTLHQDEDQISNREPYLFRTVVAARHATRDPDGGSLDARSVFRRLNLDIAVCLAAPRGRRDSWGDYHYGTGLAQAFERRGHRTRLYYFDEEVEHPHDVMISLRGLTGHEPPRNSLHVVWSISHPDLLTWDEIDACDVFLSASLTWPRMLDWVSSSSHHALPQATDRARFHPHPEVRRNDEVLFVGNSRDAERPLVANAAGEGLPLSVYGTRWRGRLPESMIKGEYVPNEELSSHYASAGVVLNDHWESMRDFGYVSNRVFDVLASGGVLLSDDVPGIGRIFGDLVTMVREGDDIRSAIDRARRDAPSPADARWVLDHHSFDNRAASILAYIETFLFGGAPTPTAVSDDRCDDEPASGEAATDDHVGSTSSAIGPIVVRGAAKRLRVAVAPQTTRNGLTSSAFIRLVQPLTSEIADVDVELARVVTDRPDVAVVDQLRGADALVVSRTALADADTAAEWLDAAETMAIPVVLDIDDAFHRMDEGHPEFSIYRERIEALDHVMRRASEIWCSTEPLAASMSEFSSRVTVVPNSLDPRLWRRYRPLHPAPVRDGDHGLELLYSGTATHGADLDAVMPALDELAQRARFRLTVVGVAPKLARRPWLRRMVPESGGQYPKYATWIRDAAPLFDVGIAPLVDNEFNRLKSDVKLLEYLALGLVPLASDVGPYETSRALAVGGTCATPEEWTTRLVAMAQERRELEDAQRRAVHARDTVWAERTAASTGARLAGRLLELARS